MQAYAHDPDYESGKADIPEEQEEEDVVAERPSTEMLLAITDLIVGGEPLPELFRSLVPPLRQLANCDVVSFALYDAMRDGVVTDFWKKDQEAGLGKIFPPEESPCGWVWQHQEAVTIPDLERETRFAEALAELRNLGVRSYTALPMSTPKRRYGALGIGWSEPEAEGSRDLLFLQRAARLVALAVENHEIHREWQKQQSRLQSLVAISRDLSSTLEMEQLVPMSFVKCGKSPTTTTRGWPFLKRTDVH